MRVVPGTPSPLACCALRRRGGWATARGSSADAWPRSLPQHVARGIGRTIREQARQRGMGAAAVAAWKLGLLIIGQLVIFPLAVLPMALRSLEHRRANACILRIGPLPHQTVDVYESHNMKKVNTAGASTTGAAEGSAAPLVLFVHGGSWAQVFVLSRAPFPICHTPILPVNPVLRVCRRHLCSCWSRERHGSTHSSRGASPHISRASRPPLRVRPLLLRAPPHRLPLRSASSATASSPKRTLIRCLRTSSWRSDGRKGKGGVKSFSSGSPQARSSTPATPHPLSTHKSHTLTPH